MSQHFQYDVFLSHSAKDKAVVRGVSERLRGDGLRVWFDEWESRPGDTAAVLALSFRPSSFILHKSDNRQRLSTAHSHHVLSPPRWLADREHLISDSAWRA